MIDVASRLPGMKWFVGRPQRGDGPALCRRRLLRGMANVLGAASAVLFAQASIRFFLSTHRLIGAGFSAQQLLVAAAFLARRPARSFSGRWRDWILAFGGTFL